jgi:nitrite reductase (NADH) small subunit
MANWVRVAAVDECPVGTAVELVAGDRVIALFNVEGIFYALDGVCPHQGGPLGDGALCGAIVTCPWHGWQFDVRTGQNQLSPRIKQPRFVVRVEDGAVWIDLDEMSNDEARMSNQ